ncbi:MAG: hypothetical protein P1R58_07290 [bacterium]|nr:hypothetical protein [bacterium]
MTDYSNITIDFLTNTPWLVGLALAALVGLAILAYLRTNPPLSGWMRLLLYTLRLIALVALFAALMEPVLSFSRQRERKPKVTLLLDRSASMSRIESELSRTARSDSLLSSAPFERFSSAVDFQQGFFGGNLSENSGEIDDSRTALGEAFDELRRGEFAEPSDYWLLMSDGNSNSGREPLETVGGSVSRGTVPKIMAIDLSMGGGEFDLALKDINFNPVLFAGEETEIRVGLSWRNAEQKNVIVELTRSNKQLSSERFQIDRTTGLGEVTLRFKPDEPGRHLFRINIPVLEGEENEGNNSRSFAVKVLKSKLLVLLATESPDYEVGFLRRFLDQSDKYEVDLSVLSGKAGNLGVRFPTRQTELNRYDLLILHDPNPNSLAGQQEIIRSFLSEKGGAAWVLLGERFAEQGPVEWFNNLLPFYQSRKRPARFVEFHGAPVEGQLFHPAVRLAEDQTSIRSAWAELPPFKVLVECDQVHPEAILLVNRSSANPSEAGLPLMGSRRFGPGKLYATAALPIWTWGFANVGFGSDEKEYDQFLQSLAGWLTVKDDLDPIRVVPDKQVYNRGETVGFDGFVFDQGYRPIPAAMGTVVLESEGNSSRRLETDLVPTDPGKYRAEFNNVEPGKYSFVGTVEKDGRILSESKGEVLVERFSLEQFDQSGNPALLTALAQATGGSYFSVNEFDQALEQMPTAAIVVDESGEIVLWNKTWLLLTIILALSLEWLVRKMNQLI